LKDDQQSPRKYETKEFLPDKRKVLVIGDGKKVRNVVLNLRKYIPDSTIVYDRDDMKEDDDQASNGGHGSQTAHAKDLKLINDNLPCDVVVFADSEPDRDAHDAGILLNVAEIRRMEAGFGEGESIVKVIAEFLDPQNAKLAHSVLGVNVMIISTELLSNYLVQTVKEPGRAKVFNELLDPDGSEISLIPLQDYLQFNEDSMSFCDILYSLRSVGHIALGYISEEENADEGLRVVLNPDKSAQIPKTAKIISLGDFY